MASHRHRLICIWSLLVLVCMAPSFAEDGTPAEEDVFTPPDGLEKGWYVRIETRMGQIIARLLPEQAPQSVAHFVGLSQGTLAWTDVISGETVKNRYYDGMPIHTVQAGRFIETGDAGSMGRSMPLLYVPEEGLAPFNFNMPYMMGMTRMSGARISAVKFFVTVSAQPWFNGDSPCFGQVVEGREVVFNISQVKSYSNKKPIEDVIIDEIRVFTVGDPPPLPEPVPFQPTRKQVEFRGGPADPSE